MQHVGMPRAGVGLLCLPVKEVALEGRRPSPGGHARLSRTGLYFEDTPRQEGTDGSRSIVHCRE